MNAPEIFAIVAAIKDAYGSLEAPDFGFVDEAVEYQGYDPVLDQLEESFEILETTDAEEDIAFTYLVSEGSEDLGLWLSMVGPYALLQRVGEDHVEILREPYSEAEEDVLATLADHGITVVPEALLGHTIKMNLPDAADGKVTLYQALFDNSQALPWDQGGDQDADEEADDAQDSQPH